MGTYIIAGLIVLYVFFVVKKLVRDVKKSPCHGCSGCVKKLSCGQCDHCADVENIQKTNNEKHENTHDKTQNKEGML